MNKSFKKALTGAVLSLGALAIVSSIYAEQAPSKNIELLTEVFSTNNITRSTKDNRHGDYTVSLDNFRLPTDLTLRDFEILGFDLSYNSLNLNLRYSPLRFSVNFNTDSINERIRIRTLLNRGDITQSQHDYMMNELNSRQVALPPSLLPIFDILEEEEEENFITEYSSKQVYDIPDSSEELQYYDLESYEVD